MKERLGPMTRCRSTVVPLVALLLLTGASHAATLSEARSAGIGWLESDQNADGSCGSGERQPLVTAETLLGRAKAQLSRGVSRRCSISCGPVEGHEPSCRVGEQDVVQALDHVDGDLLMEERRPRR